MWFRRLLTVGGGAIAAILLSTSTGRSAGEVERRWTEALRAKGWITAFSDSSRSDGVPAIIDRIVASVGGSDRVVYQLGPDDQSLGEPIVSRDGTSLAFVKTERPDATARRGLYVLELHNQAPRRIAQLQVLGPSLRGAYMRPCECGWSHDNRRLVVFEAPTPETMIEGTRPITLRYLFLVDVSTTAVTVLSRLETANGTRAGAVVTSQAWSPDNRRFVFRNATDHLRIFDTVTKSEEDIGVGTEATWSPDGKYIAAKLPTERRTDLSMRKNGDYILIQAEPPYTRRTLLNNGSSRIDSLLAFDFYGLGYSGPAIWSPDGNFLVVGRYHGEELRPYVIDAMTGVTARLSRRACGPSLGGRP